MSETSWSECIELLDRLPSLPLDERSSAIERLLRNPSPGIRGRALRVGAAILPDDKLVALLRDESDAVRRNAGVEILKLKGARSFQLVVDLLADDDPDVVLQAVVILDHLKDPRAFEPLRSALKHPDPNVAQEAIVAVGHLGDARAIADLLPFLESDTWLRMAAVQALGDIRSGAATPALDGLLTDLMIGPLAAEALARIGGDQAFRSLSAHWLRFEEDLDPETSLGLLAHALEGLPEAPEAPAGLRASLAERLRDPYRAVRVSAARCLLALAPGPEDAEALNILVSSVGESSLLPSCLNHRADLIGTLLAKPGRLRSWGFLLAARFPAATPVEALAGALAPDPAREELEPVVAALLAVRDDRLADPLLELHLSLPGGERPALMPALEAHREAVSARLAERSDLREEDRLPLAARLGQPAETIVTGVTRLPPDGRREVAGQLDERPDVVRALPWEEWIAADPEGYTELAARLAVTAGWREGLPTLRRRLEEAPSPPLVRAVGELGDRESVPLLLRLVEEGGPVPVALVLDCLGKIGGPEARRALRACAGSTDAKTSRIAYKALASCATEEDDETFRSAATHPDWLVRLAAADVLGRFSRRENQNALAQLAADPVAVVAQRAVSFLEA